MLLPNHLKKEFFLIEKEDYANYLYIEVVMSIYTAPRKEFGFPYYATLMAEYHNGSVNIYVPKKQWLNATKTMAQYLLEQPEKWEKSQKFAARYAQMMQDTARAIRKLDVQSLDNRTLLQWFLRYVKAIEMNHLMRGFMWFAEAKAEALTRLLVKYLQRQKEKYHLTQSVYDTFNLLTSSPQKTVIQEERLALLQLARRYSSFTLKQKNDAIRKHYDKYCWISYGLLGPEMSVKDFREEMKKLLREGDIEEQIHSIQKGGQKLFREQKKIKDIFRVDKKYQRAFTIMERGAYVRTISKYNQFFAFWAMRDLLKEIGRRIGLTFHEVHFLYPHREVAEALLYGKNFKKTVQSRMKYSLSIAHDGCAKSYMGKEAMDIKKKLRISTELDALRLREGIVEIKGMPSFSGRASGRVKILNVTADLYKMNDGDILVSSMTNPGLLSAMKKAAAIVTDHGGITCHAAIVARELEIPCIIGTKIATKIFKDGDRVEVDAEAGTVRKLS